MSSSISSFSPLLEDLARQKDRLKSYVLKALALGLILLACDRGLDLVLRRGLDRFFGLDRPGQVVCVGHSRTALGIDRGLLEAALSVPVVKYALNGATLTDRQAMVRHYFNRHPDSVRLVVFDVDAFMFNDEGLSVNSYAWFFPYLDDPAIADYLRKYSPSGFELALRRYCRALRYDENTLALAVRGLTGNWANLKRGTVDLERLRRQLARGEHRTAAINPASRKVFEETLRFIRSRGARVALAYIPTIDVLNDVDRAGQQRVVALLQGYAATDPGILFWDYNRDYEKRHELFFDPIHLNPEGQQVVSRRLCADIAALGLGAATPRREVAGIKAPAEAGGLERP